MRGLYAFLSLSSFSRCLAEKSLPFDVGYQNIALPKYQQFTLLTPTFKAVGGATSIDLTDIAVVKPGSASFTSKKKVLIQKVDLVSGAFTDTYQFTTAGNKWSKLGGGDVDAGEVTFGPGDAMCVSNGDTSGDALAFQFSGEVALQPISINIASGNFSLIGNFTPMNVDLMDIVPMGANGTELGTSKKKILIQKVDPESGAFTDTYQYTTAGNKWTKLGGSDLVANQVTFAPGEAMCVKNGDTKEISFAFPSPISTAE